LASRLLRRYLPFLFLAFASLCLRFYALGGFSPREARVKLSSYEYAINVVPLFAAYLKKLVLPLDLNAFYVLHPVHAATDPRFISALAVTLLRAASPGLLEEERHRFLLARGVRPAAHAGSALSLDPQNAEAKRYLERCYRRLGRS
jgi:hypothetical protein